VSRARSHVHEYRRHAGLSGRSTPPCRREAEVERAQIVLIRSQPGLPRAVFQTDSAFLNWQIIYLFIIFFRTYSVLVYRPIQCLYWTLVYTLYVTIKYATECTMIISSSDKVKFWKKFPTYLQVAWITLYDLLLATVNILCS